MSTFRRTTRSRTSGALLLLLGLIMSLLPLFGPPASAATELVIEGPFDGNSLGRCTGVDKGDPGEANTTKVLTGGSLVPGGFATYELTFPAEAEDATKTFRALDCLFAGDTAIARYEISNIDKVVRDDGFAYFEFNLSVELPDLPVGTPICNVAQTIGQSTGSQGSNRKTSAECFVLGGTLQILKVIAGTTTPLAGAVFEVVCASSDARRGVIVSPTPDGDNRVTTPDTGIISIAGPEGSNCDVTEVSAPDGYVVDDPSTTTVAIPRTELDGQLVLTYENSPETGTLTIAKVTQGGTGQFTFNINCGGVLSTRRITNSGTATVSNIPVGTSCTVTEATHPDFTNTAIVPADATVTIDSNGETVAFTNVRKTGGLTIIKTTDATGTFDFDVDCDGTAFDRLGDNPVVISLVGNATESVTLSGITTGTSCTVTERDNPLFSSIVSPGNTVVIDVDGETVNFTNTRLTGNLTVTKTTVGGSGTFFFDVDCDGTGFDQRLTITDSGTKTIAGIPTTTGCTVTEAPTTLFTSVSTPADGQVTIGLTPAGVAFTNTARPSGITLDKKVNGADHATTGDALVVHVGDPLTYTVVMTNTGEVPLRLTTLADSLLPNLAANCPQGVGSILAAGASITCTYRTTAATDANNVATVTAVDGLGRTPSATDATFVNVINPAITIVKTANPTAVADNGVVTFTYVVTNTGDVTLTDIVVTDDVLGGIGTVPSLAAGGSATLTKTMTVTASSPTHNVGTAVGTDVLGRTVSATAAADISVVLGVVVERQPEVMVVELPRTGIAVPMLVLAGLSLMAAGIGLLVSGGRRRRDA